MAGKMIYVRRSKKHPTFWEVCGGPHKNIEVKSKTEAKSIAAARRRVRTKRAKRSK